MYAGQPIGPKVAAIVLVIWVVLATIIPNVMLSFTETMGIWSRITNIVLPLGVYWLLMSLTPRVGKAAVVMFVFMFFAAFQVVLLYLYGRSVIAVDMYLNVVTTNPGEVGELLGNLLPSLVIVCILYLPPLIEGISMWVRGWELPQWWLHKSRWWASGIIAAGLVCLGLSFTVPNYKPYKELFPVNAFYNLFTAINRVMLTNDYHGTSASFSYRSKSALPDSVPQTYVLIVGETSRADNWQLLGYGKPTSPSLCNRSGLVAYGRALSQSNTTHKSVPMLLSVLDATSFGDSIYKAKSIITAFKEAGFSTWFISNQNRNHSFIDFFGEEADSCIFVRDNNPKGGCYDMDLLPYFHNALAAAPHRKLIVMHTYGSHFNYADRYPEDMRIFVPDTPTDAKAVYRPSLINAYDNTVHYTAAFIDSVITALEQIPAVSTMLYTSDHGEDIFDDDRGLFLHASPCPTYYQIHVPMIVWMSSRYMKLHPDDYAHACANRAEYVASSQSFFHTAMQLGSIKSPFVVPEHSVIDDVYAAPPRLYLNDHNEAVPLEDCGLMKHDLEKLDSLGITG